MIHTPTVLHLPSFLNQLRAEGYAVTIFTPGELHGLTPSVVEERMYTAGNHYILNASATHLEHNCHVAHI